MMKKSLLLFISFVVLLTMSGCATGMKKYSGPTRPREEIVILHTTSEEPEGIWVTKINGKSLVTAGDVAKRLLLGGPIWGLVAIGKAAQAAELLPDEYEIELFYRAGGFEAKTPIIVRFKAEAGHEYRVGGVVRGIPPPNVYWGRQNASWEAWIDDLTTGERFVPEPTNAIHKRILDTQKELQKMRDEIQTQQQKQK